MFGILLWFNVKVIDKLQFGLFHIPATIGIQNIWYVLSDLGDGAYEISLAGNQKE